MRVPSRVPTLKMLGYSAGSAWTYVRTRVYFLPVWPWEALLFGFSP